MVTVGAQIPAGSVSLQNGGATLVWHVTGAAAPASGAGPAKLQDGLVMGVDVLLDRADVSLADTRALVWNTPLLFVPLVLFFGRFALLFTRQRPPSSLIEHSRR